VILLLLEIDLTEIEVTVIVVMEIVVMGIAVIVAVMKEDMVVGDMGEEVVAMVELDMWVVMAVVIVTADMMTDIVVGHDPLLAAVVTLHSMGTASLLRDILLAHHLRAERLHEVQTIESETELQVLNKAEEEEAQVQRESNLNDDLLHNGDDYKDTIMLVVC